MRRLIDDLRAPGARLEMPRFVRPDKQDAWQELALKLCETIRHPDLPVLLINNVAEYFYTCDQEYWDLRVDFPNLAPPYPAFWVEHRLITKIHSKERGDHDLSDVVNKGRVGVLIHAVNRDDAKGEGIPENARWILWCELYIDYHQRGAVAQGPHGSIFLCVDPEGKAVEVPWMQSWAPEYLADMMKSHMTFLHPAFLAMSFLHCKNVTVIDNHEPAAKAKQFKRRHGIAPSSYKTLIIEPLKQILRTEGRSDQIGLSKAMHICRGHFRDYREGRGLFGKYHQLVWMPSIVRGTKGKEAPPREIEVRL